MTDLFRTNGQPIKLGREVGRGGEGAVFEVQSHPELVAKLYHKALDGERKSKIAWMAGVHNARLDKLTAWPLDLLVRKDGGALGFLMPRIAGFKDIHRLYSPKSRERDFPKADWRFLIHAAANTARAFAVVHETGCVIGDVNHGSVLVADNSMVSIIDCDSFQVTVNGQIYLCKVGVEDFTPPELQKRSFDTVVRQPNHDNFGLAVLIFRMLFMGRHPFAGRYLGRGEMPLARAIAEMRFVYGSRRATIQMEKPPGAPSLAIVGNVAGSLFEQAFAPEMTAGGRPSGRDWARTLDELEKQIRQCHTNMTHWYLRSLPSCPWCEMEAVTGASLFGFVFHQTQGGQFNLAAFWRQVEGVPRPAPLPPLMLPLVSPSASAIAIGRRAHRQKYAGVTGAILGFILGIPLFVVAPAAWWFVIVMVIAGNQIGRRIFKSKDEVGPLKNARDVAKVRWDQAQRLWSDGSLVNAFGNKRRQLDLLKEQLAALPSLRIRKLSELKAKLRALQLTRFLDNFEIESASIPGIGAGRKQLLESYGIETAADIDAYRVAAVPGFGPVLSNSLLEWRRSKEAIFSFDPKQAVDPRDTAKVESEILAQRQKIEKDMWTALGELRGISTRASTSRNQMIAAGHKAAQDYAQAQADYDAATR